MIKESNSNLKPFVVVVIPTVELILARAQVNQAEIVLSLRPTITHRRARNLNMMEQRVITRHPMELMKILEREQSQVIIVPVSITTIIGLKRVTKTKSPMRLATSQIISSLVRPKAVLM